MASPALAKRQRRAQLRVEASSSCTCGDVDCYQTSMVCIGGRGGGCNSRSPRSRVLGSGVCHTLKTPVAETCIPHTIRCLCRS